jgi:protein-disulfide isomerase
MAKLKIPVGANDHAQGPEDAGITLVEYGDFECPFCGQAYPIIKQVQKHFGDRLRFVFRNFPLGELHPNALEAAESAEFAAANGKFWPMHDLLFENQDMFNRETFLALAGELQLAPESLRQALEERIYEARVRHDFKGGVRSGVNGTPTFFINGLRHDGPYDLRVMIASLERAAREAKAPTDEPRPHA